MSALVPLGLIWSFNWVGLGLVLGGLGTKGLGPKLDNIAGQGALLSYTEWNNNRIADYIIAKLLSRPPTLFGSLF